MEKKTALYDIHVKYGGKIVPFAGWLLPVQYGSGIIAEHCAVRNSVGMFDVSHMGEVTFDGPDALANINMLVTNDCTGMDDGRCRYSPMCNDNGGVVDDLLVYKKSDDHYMIVVNAANRDKDAAWMKAHLFGDVKFADISDTLSQIAVQGRNAKAVLSKLADGSLFPVKYYSFRENVSAAGKNVIFSKTGYTGEDGYELYCANADAPVIWEAVMEAGKEYGLIPCGLGARDTLRLEAAMPLYGHEMTDDITPLETGLDHFVKLGKADFVGKAALLKRGEPTVERRGLIINDRGIARGGEKVFDGGREVGSITSGTMCPSTKQSIAMAIVDKTAGSDLTIEVRGKRLAAVTTPLPFYKKG